MNKLKLNKFKKTHLDILSIIILLLLVPVSLVIINKVQNYRSSAAAPNNLETEAGILSSSGVSKKSDSGASGSQFVEFNKSNPTPNPSLPPTSGNYPPETTMNQSYSVPNMSIPGYRSPVAEPRFGTKLTRVTDPSAFGGSTTVRHHYSKDSAWNYDGSYMLMGKYLLDGNDYHVIKSLPVSGEFRWSNTNPNRIYMITSSGVFQYYEISSGQTTQIRSFPGYDYVYMGPHEGNLSKDDSMVVLSGKKGSDYTAIVFDIKNNQVISTKTYPGKWDAGIDWMSISSNGQYVIQNTAYCNPGCSGAVYTLDLNQNQLLQLTPKGEHGDLTTDLDGHDYFVYVLGVSGAITKARVDTGAKTQLLSFSTGGHVSCRNVRRPGWCYATMKNSSYKEAIGFKLDGSGTVMRFAHHRSTESNYDKEAKGVVSMDGRKMLWTSDWGSSSSPFYDYVAEAY